MAVSLPRSAKQSAKASAMALFGSRTDVGLVRAQNEDSLVVQPPLFVVADGMGGHAAGEIASEIAVNTLAECAPKHADAEALGRAVEQANRDIINAALSGEGREGMGTTCTAAIVEGNRLVIAQVGDSRAYLLHAGKLTQLTRDHSLMANMIEAGQITPEEARVHPNRSVITRALGNDPDMAPDLYEINVENGDRLLICSDGLTSMLEDSEIETVLNSVSNPQRCASALIYEAVEAGGLDNVTVIVSDIVGNQRKRESRLTVRTRLTIAILLIMLAVMVGGAAWGGYAYLHHTAYLAESDAGTVAVYRGVPGSVLGFSYSELVEDSDVKVDDLAPSASERIRQGMRVDSVEEAQALVDEYRADIAKAKEAPAIAGQSASRSASSAAASGDASDASGASGPNASASASASEAPSASPASAADGQGASR